MNHNVHLFSSSFSHLFFFFPLWPFPVIKFINFLLLFFPCQISSDRKQLFLLSYSSFHSSALSQHPDSVCSVYACVCVFMCVLLCSNEECWIIVCGCWGVCVPDFWLFFIERISQNSNNSFQNCQTRIENFFFAILCLCKIGFTMCSTFYTFTDLSTFLRKA